MQILETIINKAGRVVAAGTTSGTKLLNPKDDDDFFIPFSFNAIVVDFGGFGRSIMKKMDPKRQNAAKIAAVRCSLKKTEPSNGPAMNANPTPMPSLPTLPALSAADADSSWYSIKRAFNTVKFC
mmetsp:Transcript_13774/g.28916  ORF Transcript_13774/g.28916 Transcript_13774/m.28916 type:complete len:125 (+) Transcript_13774:747-1121(+)